MKKFKKILYLEEEFVIERGKEPGDGILDLATLESHGSRAEGFNFSGSFSGEVLDFRVYYENGRPVEIKVYNVDTLDLSDSWTSTDTYYPVS